MTHDLIIIHYIVQTKPICCVTLTFTHTKKQFSTFQMILWHDTFTMLMNYMVFVFLFITNKYIKFLWLLDDIGRRGT